MHKRFIGVFDRIAAPLDMQLRKREHLNFQHNKNKREVVEELKEKVVLPPVLAQKGQPDSMW